MDALARKIHRDEKAQRKAQHVASNARERKRMDESLQRWRSAAKAKEPFLRELRQEILAALARLDASPDHKTRLGGKPSYYRLKDQGSRRSVYAWCLNGLDSGAIDYRYDPSNRLLGLRLYLTTTGKIMEKIQFTAELRQFEDLNKDMRANIRMLQTLIEAVKAL